MMDYLIAHEKYIQKKLAEELTLDEWKQLAPFHHTQIEFLQHEREIHLWVTLTMGGFFLLSLLLLMGFDKWEWWPLCVSLLALLIPYLFHYYRLENGVQRLYIQWILIQKKIGIDFD